MIVLIQCRDKVGLVATIAGIMARQNINIISMREYVDTVANRFFARLVSDNYADPDLLFQDLKTALPPYAIVNVNPEPEKKIAVLVTREHHCLGDLLIRHHFKTLGASIQCVIGNHNILGDISQRMQVPFHWIDHENKTKQEFELQLIETLQSYTVDYLVLAKFMRILSPRFVELFPLRIINIHHSFLPAFAGSHPYRQAYLRGVKLIGATAHFVNEQLDEGPIIEQQIIPVNHTYAAIDMVKAGMEIEKAVLAKALKLVFQDRIFVYNNKTIVFD